MAKLVQFEHLCPYKFTYTFWDQAGNYLLQSHKPFERGTADWLIESMELAMGEFVAKTKTRHCETTGSNCLHDTTAMWGDIKTYIGDPLNEMADAAIRREQEIQAALAANTPRTSIRNKEAELHKAELWYLISCLADTLQNEAEL